MSPTSSATKTSKVPEVDVANRVDRQLLISQLHADLHGLVMMPSDDAEIRESFRKRAIEYSGAVGVAHLTVDADGNWDLKPGNSTGRVPRRQDFVTRFGKSCQTTIDRNSIQLESFLGLQAVFLPVNIAGVRPEVILILTQETGLSKNSIRCRNHPRVLLRLVERSLIDRQCVEAEFVGCTGRIGF